MTRIAIHWFCQCTQQHERRYDGRQRRIWVVYPIGPGTERCPQFFKRNRGCTSMVAAEMTPTTNEVRQVRLNNIFCSCSSFFLRHQTEMRAHLSTLMFASLCSSLVSSHRLFHHPGNKCRRRNHDSIATSCRLTSKDPA